MTEPDDTATLTDLEGEALTHVQRLMSGTATVEDLEAAKRWQALSPTHAEAIALARRLWTRLGPVGREALAQQKGVPSGERYRIAWSRPSRRALLGGTAALAAAGAYLVVRPPLDLWPSLAELRADYRTGTGEQRQLTLADGLAVTLNTQTSIAVRAGSGDRKRIELISGEAVIIAANNLQSDLLVSAGDGRMNARNARFNVRYDGTTGCGITCLEGTVRVERLGAVVELAPGQYVTYSAGGLSSLSPGDRETVTAWQKGMLVFHQTPLSDVVAEINRYRPGKIVVLNADLGRRSVNARFPIDGVDEIMMLAQRELGARITSLPGGIVVLT